MLFPHNDICLKVTLNGDLVKGSWIRPYLKYPAFKLLRLMPFNWYYPYILRVYFEKEFTLIRNRDQSVIVVNELSKLYDIEMILYDRTYAPPTLAGPIFHKNIVQIILPQSDSLYFVTKPR